MKFLAPNTMTEAVSPLLLINWVFGIGVIEYPIGRPRRIASAFWSIVHFLNYLSVLRMANISGMVEIQESKIGSNSYRIIFYLCAAFVVVSMCLGQIRAKDIADGFSEMTGINDRMGTLGIPNYYGLFSKTQIIHMGVTFTSFSILTALHFNYSSMNFPSESSRICYSMACYYSIVLNFTVDYTFSSTIRYFRNRFQCLNALLVESDSLERRKKTVTRRQSDNEFPWYFSLVGEIHGNDSTSIRAANKQWLLYVIHETRKIHRGLCKTAMKMNRAFGIQVLFSMALSFSLLTALLYTCYTIFVVRFSNGLILSDWIYMSMPVMWITHYAMKVILIVDACESTTLEAIRTGGLINTILDTPGCDEDIREEINIFSLQLLQNPFKFTASGFFPLDYSLVHGIIGSVTTYLVIMIQMESIYAPNNVKSTPNSTISTQLSGMH